MARQNVWSANEVKMIEFVKFCSKGFPVFCGKPRITVIHVYALFFPPKPIYGQIKYFYKKYFVPAGHRCPNPSDSPLPCNAGYYSDTRGSITCQSVSIVIVLYYIYIK